MAMTPSLSDSLRVELLGSPRVVHGGRQVAPGRPQQQAVLAVLALRADQAVSKDELIDAVWGDSAPQRAAASIYTYISGLRQLLSDDSARKGTTDVLTSSRVGYTLHLPTGGLDVTSFEEGWEHARRAVEAGNSADAIASLRRVLRLWRGEALADVPGPFAASQRAHLNELRLVAVEQHARLVLDCGRSEEAVDELAELTAQYPMRENPRGLLMEALYQGGDRDAAIQLFHQTRMAMIVKTGTEPGAALRKLHQRILANDPTLLHARERDSWLAVARRLQRSGLVRMLRSTNPPGGVVGRDVELRTVREAVRHLLAGSGGSIWIEGEAGIGKTALLLEALHPAEIGEHAVLLWGEGDHLTPRRPLAVMTAMLEPLMAAVPNGRDVSDHGHDSVNCDIVRAVSAVRFAAERTPVIIVADDLQWADDASLASWRDLYGLTQQLPLLLIGACRPSPEWTTIRDLSRWLGGTGTIRIGLGPLTPADTGKLVKQRLGAQVGLGLRAILDEASGNPRYITELIRSSLDGGSLVIDAGVADLDSAPPDPIPPDVNAAVLHQLQSLSDDLMEFLRWASLLGHRFSAHDANRVLGLPPGDLRHVVEEATSFGILVANGTQLSFRHPLVRRVFVERTPAALRVALHRQIAEALAAEGASVEVVAEQLLAAEVPIDRWVVGWLNANMEILSAAAPHAAAELLIRARPSGAVFGGRG